MKNKVSTVTTAEYILIQLNILNTILGQLNKEEKQYCCCI